jgi:uncharacterized protein YggU (UPF0235/DUF167 family)
VPRPAKARRTPCWVRLLAKTFGVAPSRVEIIGGSTSRIKRVKISGNTPALVATLEKIARAS